MPESDPSRLRPVNCTRCPELGNVPAIATTWPEPYTFQGVHREPRYLALCNSCSMDLICEGLSIVAGGTDPKLIRKRIEKEASDA